MPDRYDQSLEALREAPTPERWDEIVARTTDPAVALLFGDRARRMGQRLWPVVAGVAAVGAVLVGANALGSRQGSDVPPGGDVTATVAPSTTATTAPSTTATTERPPFGTAPRPPVEDLGNQPVSACAALPLANSAPPTGIAPTIADPPVGDRRVPQGVNLTGMFTGDTPDRAVLVAAGWPDVGVDTGVLVDGPFPGTRTWIAPLDGDTWLAQLTVPMSAEVSCPALLIGVGLDETDFRQFVDGLTLQP